MKIRRTIQLIQGVFHVIVDLDRACGSEPSITPLEQDKLDKHGDFAVAVGGLIEPDTGADVTLDTKSINVPSELPVKQVFSLADYANAESLAAAWRAKVTTNIGTGLTTLLANDEAAVEDVVNLPA